MSSSKISPERRKKELAQIHIGASRLFGDISKHGTGRGDYEDWLEQQCGKRSSAKLNDRQRFHLIKRLKRDGCLEEGGRGGSGHARNGATRPTSAQWAKIAAIARMLGWEDALEDARLQGFAKRTVKLENTRFMTREQASKLITGLEALAKEGAKNAMP